MCYRLDKHFSFYRFLWVLTWLTVAFNLGGWWAAFAAFMCTLHIGEECHHV